MKKILTTVLICTLLGIMSCDGPGGQINDTESTETSISEKLTTIEYDGCEYVYGVSMVNYNMGFGYLAHKGNCKYCNPDVEKEKSIEELEIEIAELKTQINDKKIKEVIHIEDSINIEFLKRELEIIYDQIY